MKVKVNLPKSGMGIEEGTVLCWRKNIGDTVVQGEVLLDVETAKAVQEVLAPVAGTLVEILVPVGETAPVRTALGVIDAPTM